MSNADDIFWRRFGFILSLLILFGFIVAFIARDIAGDAHDVTVNSPTAVEMRIAPTGAVRVGNPNETVAAEPPAKEIVVTAVAPAMAGDAAVDGESIYNGACLACHAAGVAGAPKLGDQAAWAPRIALGEDALVMSVVNGKGAMPAKGGNASLSEDQIRGAVKYMLEQSGGSAAAPGKAETVAATAPATAVEKAAEPMPPAASASPATSGGEAAGKPGDQVYNMGCVACHATGAANAPKLTDKAAWETLAGAGAAALLSSVVNGKGAMPAKGGIPTLTESDLRNAVRYMLREAGVEAGS